jgi:hypothetical protein
MTIDWKKPAIFGAAFGIAAVLTAIAAFGIFYWYSSRPTSWDADTIKSISTTAVQTFTLNERKTNSQVRASI